MTTLLERFEERKTLDIEFEDGDQLGIRRKDVFWCVNHPYLRWPGLTPLPKTYDTLDGDIVFRAVAIWMV